MLISIKKPFFKKRFPKKKFNPRWVKRYVIFSKKMRRKFPKYKKIFILKLKKKIKKEKYLFFFRRKFFFLKKRAINLSKYFKVFCLRRKSLIYKLRKKIFYRKLLKSEFFLDTFLQSLEFKKLKLFSPSPIFDNKSLQLKLKKKLVLVITVHSNNIFMNLSQYFNKKVTTIFFSSAGMYSFDCSKKKLKFAIYTFFKQLKQKFKGSKIFAIKIAAPKYLNKYIFKQLKRTKFIKAKFLIYTSFKVFNGCRSKKKRRKKRLRFRFRTFR